MLATFDNTILVLLAPTYRTQLYVQCIKAKKQDRRFDAHAAVFS